MMLCIEIISYCSTGEETDTGSILMMLQWKSEADPEIWRPGPKLEIFVTPYKL